tara:strand:+ start:275 stop:1000 length:726 start_codon:yes stop_codon:yes gene_type:complete
MKQIILVVVFLLVGTSSLLANKDNRPLTSTFFEFYSYQYDEPSLMSKASKLPFLGFGLEYKIPVNRNNFIGNLRFNVGRTDYSSVNTGNSYKDNTMRLNFEQSYQLQFNAFNLYSGLGVRWLYDNSGGGQTTTGHGTYDRRSVYFYLPIGLSFSDAVGTPITGQINILIKGHQKSFLGDKVGFTDIKNEQNSGYGLSIDYKVSSRSEIFLDYWEIEKSNLVQGYYEPENQTWEAGFRFFLN